MIRRKSRAFTLVELLVVIGIIALLVAILLPSLRKARDAAIRTKCAANLRVWGQAIHNYSSDNKGRLPISWAQGRSPSVFWWDSSAHLPSSPTDIDSRKEASLDKFAPYLKGWAPKPGVPLTQQILKGVWVCPAVGDQQAATPGWFQNDKTHVHYAYFCGVSIWNSTWLAATARPQDLTNLKLSADRLIMADMILAGQPRGLPGSYLFNHSVTGSSSNAVFGTDGPNGWGVAKNIAGINHLYGDGHVVWISKDELNPTKMDADPTWRRTYETNY